MGPISNQQGRWPPLHSSGVAVCSSISPMWENARHNLWQRGLAFALPPSRFQLYDNKYKSSPSSQLSIFGYVKIQESCVLVIRYPQYIVIMGYISLQGYIQIWYAILCIAIIHLHTFLMAVYFWELANVSTSRKWSISDPLCHIYIYIYMRNLLLRIPLIRYLFLRVGL